MENGKTVRAKILRRTERGHILLEVPELRKWIKIVYLLPVAVGETILVWISLEGYYIPIGYPPEPV